MGRASHKALFQKFRDDSLINRCEQFARWTLPYTMTDQCEVSSSGRAIVERDYQEMGAILTNGLASKLARLLFPTQHPFFQASASPAFKKAAERRGMDETTLRNSFAQIEMASNRRLFLNAGYASLILALKHLIITGNTLLHRDSKAGKVTAYGMQQFVTRRSGDGTLMDCILREFTTVEALPLELQDALRVISAAKYGRPEQTVEKYTRIHRTYHNGVEGYEVSQEVDTISVGDASWYPKNLCPWMAPTWNLIPGEHYGRGMVEDYAGGFAKLSSLSESSALYTVEILRVLHLVGAGAGSDVDELATAESGEYVRGDPEQIKVHEAGDANKLSVVDQVIESTTARLARAFMYGGGVRDAERVTAAEIRADAEEVEHSLGGVYSTLSGGLQVPLAHILMTEVSDQVLAGLITGQLQPDVTAGIPALGRSADVQNILLATQEIAAIAPIVQLDDRIDPKRLIDMIMAGRSVDVTAIQYPPEEYAKVQEAKKQLEQAQQGMIAAQSLQDSGDQITQTIQGV